MLLFLSLFLFLLFLFSFVNLLLLSVLRVFDSAIATEVAESDRNQDSSYNVLVHLPEETHGAHEDQEDSSPLVGYQDLYILFDAAESKLSEDYKEASEHVVRRKD